MFKKNKTEKKGYTTAQTRTGERHPFSIIDDYIPLKKNEFKLYRSLREAVPVIDAAIIKLIRLTNDFEIKCKDTKAQDFIDNFFYTTPSGRGQTGLIAFVDQYLDSLLTCGMAVGEMILKPSNNGIYSLYCADMSSIELKLTEDVSCYLICAKNQSGQTVALKNQELLFYTGLNPEPDYPAGVSILRSMPFCAGVLLKIYNTTGINFERAGNVRFAVTYNPNNSDDISSAEDKAKSLAAAWSSAMNSYKNGSVSDFVAVGDVKIQAIGADNQIIDTNVPVRQMLEQIVSRTGVPPFLLGLSWSSTERMSSQQADILTSELEAIRRAIAPVIRKIVKTELELNGITSGFEVCFKPINLQDEVEEAKAKLYLAQAKAKS